MEKIKSKLWILYAIIFAISAHFGCHYFLNGYLVFGIIGMAVGAIAGSLSIRGLLMDIFN